MKLTNLKFMGFNTAHEQLMESDFISDTEFFSFEVTSELETFTVFRKGWSGTVVWESCNNDKLILKSLLLRAYNLAIDLAKSEPLISSEDATTDILSIEDTIKVIIQNKVTESFCI